ncbi:MAG: hypothetical protein EXR92_00795 [Gemmatimonadetes bacterium]|nr:hypothetical protein [Gemmatimonadota bacterium]
MYPSVGSDSSRKRSVERISAILPIRLSGTPGDLTTFARGRTLLASLDRRGLLGIFQEILLVVPDRELSLAHRLVAPFADGPFTVIGEDEAFPQFRTFPGQHEYRKQQLIKLGATARAATEFTLTLDADVYCCHSFETSDLVIEGRALMQMEPRAMHAPWWKASAELLSTEPDRSPLGMSGTPALLSRTISRALLAALESLHGRDPIALLLDQASSRWTEYTLYHLCAEKNGLLDRFHLPAGEQGRPSLICEASLWSARSLPDWDPSPCFSRPPSALFIVCQSNTGLPPDLVAAKLSRLEERRGVAMCGGDSVP